MYTCEESKNNTISLKSRVLVEANCDDKEFSMPRKDDGRMLTVLVTLLMTVICLGLSFINVADAYKEIMRGSYFLSGLLSLAITAGLFLCAFKMRQAKLNRESWVAPLIFYIALVIASFAGNFNGFYSYFMRGELLKTELTEKADAFRTLREDSRVALGDFKDQSPQINQLASQLESQIRNPSEPGCGPKCEEKLVELEGVLGTKLTRLKAADKEFLVREYKKMIDEARKALLSKLNSAEQKDIITQMDEDATTLQPAISAATQDAAEKALPVITTIVEKYKFYGAKVRSFVGKAFIYDDQMTVKNAEIGKMSHTFSSAFQNLNHWGPWIAAFVAILIDIIVPIMILGLTKPEDDIDWGRPDNEPTYLGR